MKTLVATAILVLAANGASAAGFSPWVDAAAPREAAEVQNIDVEPAGFAPWRDRVVVEDPRDDATSSEIASTPRPQNVFRPWS